MMSIDVSALLTMNYFMQWKLRESLIHVMILICLSIFLPRIIKSLTQFASAWNLHSVRTEKNWSPQQIMINSLIKDTDLVLSNDKISEYGIDYDGPVAEEEFGTVNVPVTLCPPSVSQDHFYQFRGHRDTI